MKIFYSALLLLLLEMPVMAASSATGKIQAFYDSLNGFTANFSQTLEHRESGSKEVRNGKLIFKKPLLINWTTQKPNEESIIVNSREIWNYLPEEEVAYRYSPDMLRDSHSIIQVLTGAASLNKEFEVQAAGSEGKLAKLKLYPHEPTTQMVEAEIWVDETTGQIKRARIIDFYGNANDVTLSAFKPEKNLANSLFNFKPPAGIDVEDRGDGSGKPLFQ